VHKVIIFICAFLILLFLNFKQEDFSKISSFRKEYVSKYEEVYQNNDFSKKETVEAVNFSVDNDLELEDINQNIINLITAKSFNKQKTKDYLALFKLYPEADYKNVLFYVNEDLDVLNEEFVYLMNNLSENEVRTMKNNKYFLFDNYKDYVSYLISSKNNLNEEVNIDEIIDKVNMGLDKEFYTDFKMTDTSKDYLMLVNKYNKLDASYVPANLVTVEVGYGYQNQIRSDVYEVYKQMHADASKEGILLYIASPYRSYATQETLYNYYVSTDGVKNADTYSARPGFSEHQTGLAIDLIREIDLDLDSFENSPAFYWMQNNAYKYGFIMRFEASKEHITGYKYEPWHYRYVGVEVATKIRELGITFDEYYYKYIEKS
jgi:LAS superfamily LD-carboxypeptidase LdcB